MFRMVRNNLNGYTLIELLIALALLGIVATPLLNLFATGYCFIGNARMHTTALNLCRARLEETRALGYSAVYDLYLADAVSPVSELDPLGFTGFTRETKVTLINLQAAADTSLPVELLQIDVTVLWWENNSELKETISTYLGKR